MALLNSYTKSCTPVEGLRAALQALDCASPGHRAAHSRHRSLHHMRRAHRRHPGCMRLQSLPAQLSTPIVKGCRMHNFEKFQCNVHYGSNANMVTKLAEPQQVLESNTTAHVEGHANRKRRRTAGKAGRGVGAEGVAAGNDLLHRRGAGVDGVRLARDGDGHRVRVLLDLDVAGKLLLQRLDRLAALADHAADHALGALQHARHARAELQGALRSVSADTVSAQAAVQEEVLLGTARQVAALHPRLSNNFTLLDVTVDTLQELHYWGLKNKTLQMSTDVQHLAFQTPLEKPIAS